MIDEVYILHECHCCDFAHHSGKKVAGLLCIVAYHHKIVVELGKYCFDSFAKSLVGLRRRSPVLLIQPVWNLQCDVCKLKKGFAAPQGIESMFGATLLVFIFTETSDR